MLSTSRWTTETKTAVGFAAAVVLVFAIGLIAYEEVNRFIETNQLVSHTLDVLKEIEATQANVTTGEAQQRAFIITGDDSYIESYKSAGDNADNNISTLHSLTADNPTQQSRLENLRTLIEQRFSRLQQGIDLYQEQGFEATQNFIIDGTGRDLMLSIQGLLDDMRQTENKLLAERTGFSESGAQLSRLTLIVLMGSAFVLITIIYVLIRNDITGRKKSAQALTYERDLLQSVMDNIPDNIYIKDTATRFVRINASSARFFGLASVEDAIGKTDFDFQQADLARNFFEEEQRIIQSRQPITDRYEFNRDSSGGERWLSASKAPIFTSDGQVSGIVGISRDITNRKLAEDEIKKLNENLKRQSAELVATNRELEAFSYSVSHDLRTPLRAIDGFSQALLEDYGDKLDNEGQSYLKRVRAASQRMAELIDDLLNLSRVTRAEMRQETVDLSLLAQQVINSLQKADGAREVKFTLADNLKATGDPHLLRIALENLLGNAWKFTQKKAEAEIVFGSTGQENGQTAYFIRDNGAGFDMNYVSKLFGAFQRLHAANDFPGTGIGLATVQRIIHRHGGKIWAEGSVDQGATFYFTL